MLLKLDMSSRVPIYMQIRNQIVLGIASGELAPGEKLPTIRALAEQSGAHFRPKPALHGRDICLSGIENQCQAMLAREEAPADIARYCLDAVLAAVLAMTQAVLDRWGPLPVLCAGGVASNGKFRRVMGAQFGARFAPPAFSSDNAAGVALIAARALSL